MDVEQYREGPPVKMPDGTLVKDATDSTVYVISEGLKRAIPSEAIFTSYGYSWKNVITVPSDVLAIHPDGDTLQAAAADSVQTTKKK